MSSTKKDEDIVFEWLGKVSLTGVKKPPDSFKTPSCLADLKDGCLLCQFITKIQGKAFLLYNKNPRGIDFMEQENIQTFQKTCSEFAEKNLGDYANEITPLLQKWLEPFSTTTRENLQPDNQPQEILQNFVQFFAKLNNATVEKTKYKGPVLDASVSKKFLSIKLQKPKTSEQIVNASSRLRSDKMVDDIYSMVVVTEKNKKEISKKIEKLKSSREETETETETQFDENEYRKEKDKYMKKLKQELKLYKQKELEKMKEDLNKKKDLEQEKITKEIKKIKLRKLREIEEMKKSKEEEIAKLVEKARLEQLQMIKDKLLEQEGELISSYEERIGKALLKNHTKQISTLEEKIQLLESSIQNKLSENTRIKISLNEKDSKLKKLTQEVDRLKSKLENAENEIASMTIKLKDALPQKSTENLTNSIVVMNNNKNSDDDDEEDEVKELEPLQESDDEDGEFVAQIADEEEEEEEEEEDGNDENVIELAPAED